MNFGKKLVNKVKPIFGKKASRTERATENGAAKPDVTISRPPVQPLGDGTHASRPDSPDGEAGRDPSTSNTRNRRRAAADNDKDGGLAVSSRQLPTGDSPSESMRFEDIQNSGFSFGGGPVNVSNQSTSNTFSGSGTFIQNNTPSDRIRPGLEVLQRRVATSAFHNSAHRVDPPRCHPDTRVAIQKQIYDWILTKILIRQTWIMWMHGAAGAGKSAIMQSVAELCEKANIPLASFFFFRTDPSRNSMTHFIATLVYQLIQKIPQVRNEIFTIIENNPLIFDESLESQLEKLIIQPLLRLPEHFKRFFVIMIDGLDECIQHGRQSDLIKLLGAVSRSRTTPVIFLVASRREPQIEAAFGRKQISDLVLTLPLDNSDIEQTSDDIRRFLTDRFQDITETHLHRRLLPINWPPVSMVEEIVTKSSGQFIYASVVINYVSSPRGNPVHLLEIVHGVRMRDPSSQNPFAHLDALYQYIFSQVEGLDKVLDILALALITLAMDILYIEYVFLLEPGGGLEVCLADLAAVITLDTQENKLKFLHASLPDFLRDKTRSERYHIDMDEYSEKLLHIFLNREPLTLDQLVQANHLDTAINQEIYRLWEIRDLLARGAKASDQLRQSFLAFSIKFNETSFGYLNIVGNLIEVLESLKKLNFDDEGKAYYHVLNMFAVQIAKHWTSLGNDDQSRVRKNPDLFACICQIHQEEL